ncbi:nuclear transport factor 2 family protein [Dactylosporangium sp. NPDC048998]|uniref:nuclear transport factor 2 family protein n=1 Tax=Dactylosporangium sp. NPDC048998 TaxID=3363976 RepID=UPI003721CC57
MTYARVQQFYAAQMRLLDDGKAEEWAATFTEDGEFGQDRRPAPRRGRLDIGAGLRRAADALAERGAVRRHWLGMLTVDERPDGTLHTRYYALVIETPRGGVAALHLSTAVDDVLVRHGDSYLVRSRYVVHDGHTA